MSNGGVTSEALHDVMQAFRVAFAAWQADVA